MEAANLAGGGGRVVPPHPGHPPQAQVHPLYMPHLAIKTVHQTLGENTLAMSAVSLDIRPIQVSAAVDPF